MITSQAVRDARKKAQLDRLARKGDADYPQFYAKQPQQLVKAQENEQIRLDKVAVRDTAEALQISEITGEGILSAQEKATVAQLVLKKHLDAQQPNVQISLTGGA